MPILRAIRTFIHNHRQITIKHPMMTQAIQVGTLMGIGDILAQTIENREKFDYKRLARFTGGGLFYVGPAVHLWFVFLHRKIKTKNPYVAVFQKLALDQFVFCPLFMPTHLFVHNVLEGFTYQQTIDKLKRDYWSLLKANYAVWPMLQAINFYLIPVIYQVLFSQLCGVFWNTYVSWKLYKRCKKTPCPKKTGVS